MSDYQDINSDGVEFEEDIESQIQQKIARQRDLIAIEEWEAFEQEDPENAAYVRENYRELGFRKVIKKTPDGQRVECFIPVRKTEEELRRARERREKYYNRPSAEDYLSEARQRGSTETDAQIIESYVQEYYDVGF